MPRHDVLRRARLDWMCGVAGGVLIFLLLGWVGRSDAQLPVARHPNTGHRQSDRDDVDQRLTWVHWWEVNRDGYLTPALRRVGRAERQNRPELEIIDAVTTVLLKVTEVTAKDTPAKQRLRAAAAMTLGRINTSASVRRVLELVHDPSQQVRTSAWLALGASGEPEARARLLQGADEMTECDRIARAAALGMFEPGDPQAIHRLTGDLVADASPESRRMALRSLRLLRAGELTALSREVLAQTTDADYAALAVLGMGVDPSQEDAEMVLSLLDVNEPGLGLPIASKGIPAEVRFSAAMTVTRYAGMLDERQLHKVLTRKILGTTDSGLRDYYRGPALISFVDVAKPDDWQVFLDALDGKTKVVGQRGSLRKRVKLKITDEQLRGEEPLPKDGSELTDQDRADMRITVRLLTRPDDPIRGYAALAIGMHINRLNKPVEAGAETRSRYYDRRVKQATRKLMNALSKTLNTKSESSRLRAAVVMGLAISEHPDAAEQIVRGLERIDPDDEMVMGYGSLALAMLGDDRAVVLAHRYLSRLSQVNGESPADNARLGAVLGRRAMVLALGLVGNTESAVILRNLWGHGPWVSLEAAKVLSWLGDDTLAVRLIQAIETEPDTSQAVLAVVGLGELLDHSRPSRLGRLVAASHYALGYQDLAEVIESAIADKPVTCPHMLRNAKVGRESQAPGNLFLYYALLN